MGKPNDFVPASINAPSRKKVLVVDDCSDNRLIVLTILEDQYAIEEAETTEAALRLVESWQPDVVIQDIARPDFDGFYFLRLLKKTNPSLPVINLTANSTDADRQLSVEAGAFAHIAKPITDMNVLFDVVAQAIASTK